MYLLHQHGHKAMLFLICVGVHCICCLLHSVHPQLQATQHLFLGFETTEQLRLHHGKAAKSANRCHVHRENNLSETRSELRTVYLHSVAPRDRPEESTKLTSGDELARRRWRGAGNGGCHVWRDRECFDCPLYTTCLRAADVSKKQTSF